MRAAWLLGAALPAYLADDSGAAATAAATKADTSSDATAAPATWQALNPPSCAVGFADIAKDITNSAAFLVSSTLTCAKQRGWSGWLLTDAPSAAGFTASSALVSPFHSQLLCTYSILDQINRAASVAADAMNMAYVCFSNNQGCGQSIASAIAQIVWSAKDVVAADFFCRPVGKDAPHYMNNDAVKFGLICWQKVWSVIQRFIKTAKYIDTATALCTPAVPEPEPSPQPEPQPEVAAGGAAAPAGGNATSASLGASAWSELSQQSQPWAHLGDMPTGDAERRLSDFVEGLPDAHFRAEVTDALGRLSSALEQNLHHVVAQQAFLAI